MTVYTGKSMKADDQMQWSLFQTAFQMDSRLDWENASKPLKDIGLIFKGVKCHITFVPLWTAIKQNCIKGIVQIMVQFYFTYSTSEQKL